MYPAAFEAAMPLSNAIPVFSLKADTGERLPPIGIRCSYRASCHAIEESRIQFLPYFANNTDLRHTADESDLRISGPWAIITEYGTESFN